MHVLCALGLVLGLGSFGVGASAGQIEGSMMGFGSDTFGCNFVCCSVCGLHMGLWGVIIWNRDRRRTSVRLGKQGEDDVRESCCYLRQRVVWIPERMFWKKRIGPEYLHTGEKFVCQCGGWIAVWMLWLLMSS